MYPKLEVTIETLGKITKEERDTMGPPTWFFSMVNMVKKLGKIRNPKPLQLFFGALFFQIQAAAGTWWMP